MLAIATMEEKHASFESSPEEANAVSSVGHSINNNNINNSDHGWQKVTYTKRQKKTKPNNNSHALTNSSGAMNGADNIFRSIERQSEDRRRRILEVQRAVNAGIADIPFRSKQRSDYDDEYDDDDDDAGVAAEDGKAEDTKRVKPKKVKKPKVTVAEAAAKIDAADLAVFLADISVGILIGYWVLNCA